MSAGANPVPFVVVGFLFIAFGFYGGSLSDDMSRWIYLFHLLYDPLV
jgi:hypothetical protein